MMNGQHRLAGFMDRSTSHLLGHHLNQWIRILAEKRAGGDVDGLWKDIEGGDEGESDADVNADSDR